MSGKVKNKGSSNYDIHNNIMALEGDIDDQMKYKINKVMEVIKNRSQEDVMLVLQYFDYDIDTTIDAFLEDGASDILKKWNHTNSIKPNNKNKKKKNKKKKSSVQESAASLAATQTVNDGESASAACAEVVSRVDVELSNGDASSPLEGSSSSSQVEGSNKDSTVSAVEDAQNRVSPLLSVTDVAEPQWAHEQESAAVSRLTEQAPMEPASSSQSEANLQGSTLNSAAERSSVSPSEYSRNTNRNRHRSSGSQSRSPQEAPPPVQVSANPGTAPPAASQAPGKKILVKSLKDLSRQTVALHRVSNILEEELDTSFKRIKTAIAEAQRLLEVRNQDLENEMERVKKESRQLLNQRKEMAAELKLRAERASTMSESELNELRADIKHFVVERKYDEELGKTCRFMWDKDRITEEIKSFGEVCHVKNCYSQRRQSVSSVASSSNMTSSITEPPELSPVSQTELDQEISEPNHEHAVPEMRPQGTTFSSRARFFFRRTPNSDSNNRQGYNRGNYHPRGRGSNENRGGRGGGRGGGGRRDDGYRGGHDAPYYSKPHYSQKSDDHGSFVGGAGVADGSVGSSGTTSWPPREQRASRRGSGRHNNSHFQGRMQAHHSPRRNFCNDERVTTTTAASDTHVNGKNEEPDLMNGFVDH